MHSFYVWQLLSIKRRLPWSGLKVLKFTIAVGVFTWGLCGTLGSMVRGFGQLLQTTPKLYWKNPKLFKLLGKKNEKECSLSKPQGLCLAGHYSACLGAHHLSLIRLYLSFRMACKAET